jgi:8-oxo-dGTP diphosphatase
MAATPKHSVSVAGVVVRDRDGAVLAIQRQDNAHWEPPGGVLELDETFESGVRREVLEETGLHVEVDHLSGVYKNLTRGVVALVFRCSYVSGEIASTPESRRVEWLSREEVGSRMAPAYAVRVFDALTESSSVVVRAHDGVNILETN